MGFSEVKTFAIRAREKFRFELEENSKGNRKKK